VRLSGAVYRRHGEDGTTVVQGSCGRPDRTLPVTAGSARAPAAGQLEADWSDGHHELALELGEPDDDRIDRAMAALDDVPQLDGWWSSKDPQGPRR
jgi:hypothetical protein